ncbi:hypothetical protein KR96_19065 [Ralstonia solanacearum]|nr:hypothetical protein KR96_19065 [Ralstonia solanacearum]KFX81264.1 hypothetical protein KR99_24480 [Ralstonia solanacearum]
MVQVAIEQRQMQSLSNAVGLPVPQAMSARHAAAKAQCFGQLFSRDTGMQNKQDAVQRRPIIPTRAAFFG